WSYFYPNIHTSIINEPAPKLIELGAVVRRGVISRAESGSGRLRDWKRCCEGLRLAPPTIPQTLQVTWEGNQKDPSPHSPSACSMLPLQGRAVRESFPTLTVT